MEWFFGLYTLAAMLGFLKLCAWAFDPKQAQGFRAASELPFNDSEALAEKRKQLILSAF